MDKDRQCHSIPLVSRLDRLDSVMNYVEGKQNLTRWSRQELFGRLERQCKPLDMAVREVHSKGSLLDRVASLEDRLLQLCLEIESRNISHSLPIFNSPKCGYKQHCIQNNGFECKRKPHRVVQQRLKQPNITMKQQEGNKDDKNCKSGKKGVPPNWPHLRILGC